MGWVVWWEHKKPDPLIPSKNQQTVHSWNSKKANKITHQPFPPHKDLDKTSMLLANLQVYFNVLFTCSFTPIYSPVLGRFFRPNIHWVDLGDLALFERFGVLPKTIWISVVASRCWNRFRPIDNQGVSAQQNAEELMRLIKTPWIKAGTTNKKTLKYYKSGVTCIHTVYWWCSSVLFFNPLNLYVFVYYNL